MGELKSLYLNRCCRLGESARCLNDRRLLRLAVMILILIYTLPCSVQAVPSKKTQTKGVYHRIKKGETLMRISRAYGIPVQTIAEANHIKTAGHIEIGQAIFIPGAARVIDDTSAEQAAEKGKKEKRKKPPLSVKSKPPLDKERKNGRRVQVIPKDDPDDKDPAQDDTNQDQRNEPQVKKLKKRELPENPVRKKGETSDSQTIRNGDKRFLWPLRGKIISRFGRQPDGMLNNGIKISTRQDKPVIAADRGIVIYSAPLKDYGETVIIKHEGQYATVYTHLGERMVKVDEQVRQGAKIGLPSGMPGKSEGIVGFEVRYKNKAVNPIRYLIPVTNRR